MKNVKYIKISFDKFVSNIYLPFAKMAKRSWQVDERIARKYLSPTFGHLLLEQINPSMVSAWFVGLTRIGLCPSTCNRILAVMKAICSFSVKNGYMQVGSSPCAGISSLPLPPPKQRTISRDDAKRLMSELKKYKCQEAAIIRLLFLTGARKSEILKARVEDVDLEKNILNVPLSKSGRTRQIILSKEAVKIIKIYVVQANGPWLFTGRVSTKPLTDIYGFWNKIRNKLGLTGVRIHDLRHSFASLLINDGYTLYDVQKLLGHTNPRTTMRYAHLSDDVMRKATESVSRMICATIKTFKIFNKFKWPLFSALSNIFVKRRI